MRRWCDFFGYKEQLLFFTDLTPVSKQLHSSVVDQTAEYPSDALTCARLYLGLQPDELRCPPLAKVAEAWKAPWAVGVKMSY